MFRVNLKDGCANIIQSNNILTMTILKVTCNVLQLFEKKRMATKCKYVGNLDLFLVLLFAVVESQGIWAQNKKQEKSIKHKQQP